MKKAIDYDGKLKPFLDKYKYQTSLTNHLDNIGNANFDQLLLNEIVLWKVNRYVAIDDDLFENVWLKSKPGFQLTKALDIKSS